MISRPMHPAGRISGLTTLLLLLGACVDSELLEPEEPTEPTVTVQAITDWAFVAFNGDEAATVNVSDPSTSTAWDIAFFGISTMLNGGAAGPGGVTGTCICQNAGASDAAVLAMTSEGALAEFEAVTSASIPTDPGAWLSDALGTAISGWYAYDVATHQVSAVPERVWYVRTASGTAFAKFHVTAIAGATQEHAGTVTVRFALQPTAGASFEPVRTVEVDLSGGPVHFDLETASEVGEEDGWDLLFEDYLIRVNGGVSGSGSGGALPTDGSFEEVTDMSDIPPQVYVVDHFGGVFRAHTWYRYDLLGNHQIHPTYDVFLIRRGEAVHKLQITNYYSPTGAARHITFRHARLR